jgi:hypothetical protein
MRNSSFTYFQVMHNSTTIEDEKGNKTFLSESEAIQTAFKFKNNPRIHDKTMSDELVEFWKKQTLTIIKETVKTQEIRTI